MVEMSYMDPANLTSEDIDLQSFSGLLNTTVLLDSGSNTTMINAYALPKETKAMQTNAEKFVGIHGPQTLDKKVFLMDISLPKFSLSQCAPGPFEATVFYNKHSNYGIIVSQDLLQALGIKLNFETKQNSFNENTIDFKPAANFL